MDGVGSQAHTEPDLFSISELDFDLPPLDSPEQAAMLDVNPSKDQAQTTCGPGLLQTVSGNAQLPHEHKLNSPDAARPDAARPDAVECTNAGDDSSLAEARLEYESGPMMALPSSEMVSNCVVLLLAGMRAPNCNLLTGLHVHSCCSLFPLSEVVLP